MSADTTRVLAQATGTLTADRLRELLNYDPGTGVFTRKVGRAGNAKEGEVAGYRSRKGYRVIKIDCRPYKAHRLAWLYETGAWPADLIDHINGIKDDNRFVNLREATNAENIQNAKRFKSNSSGFKGVSFLRGRWSSRIRIGGKSKWLGWFYTPEEAYAAYISAAEKYHGEFARLT